MREKIGKMPMFFEFMMKYNAPKRELAKSIKQIRTTSLPSVTYTTSSDESP